MLHIIGQSVIQLVGTEIEMKSDSKLNLKLCLEREAQE